MNPLPHAVPTPGCSCILCQIMDADAELKRSTKKYEAFNAWLFKRLDDLYGRP